MCKKNEDSVRKEGPNPIDAWVYGLLVGSPLKPQLRAAAWRDLQQVDSGSKVIAE